jgi:hypothetical protein
VFIMVARVNNEMLSQALLTPRPDVSDSDDVLLALETARALETQGELREAARWLRRAAEEAEKQGNDERVLALARAAADLTTAIGSSPPTGDAVTMRPTGDAVTMPPPSQGVVDTLDAQYPPTTPPPESFEPTIPPPASMPAGPAASATESAAPPPATVSSPPEPFTERSMRIAILEGSIRGAKSFFVERLERGQLPPSGATEAMLVFTGEDEGSEQDVNLLAASDSERP